ncbi:hypothetical protein Q8A67_017793 [Cirrhinus molitorella]|uniref:Uncharacterized protein n=1 Tax=Cirrhinus molitorella TaxID=172907 RepID=A0AA88TS07_9TELE|nr:hypothetical protein Q8A67_017793 [Cirrhinus molitorella]
MGRALPTGRTPAYPAPLSPPSPHLPQLHAAGICPPLGNGAVTLAGCSPQRLDLIYLSCLQLTNTFVLL